MDKHISLMKREQLRPLGSVVIRVKGGATEKDSIRKASGRYDPSTKVEMTLKDYLQYQDALEKYESHKQRKSEKNRRYYELYKDKIMARRRIASKTATKTA